MQENAPERAANIDAGSDAPRSPEEAFDAGLYDIAASGFSRRAERNPKDPKAQFNLGSALHQLNDYEGAQAAFERALESPQTSLRAKALYDLGNTSFRQGQLEQAIEHYRNALEIAPDDEDAKHNLEFVQRELERREQQAQQRQQQEQSGQDQSDQQKPDQQAGDQSQNQQGEGQQEPNEQSPDQQDSDGDGLSDQLERQAENPTDPNRADSDGDGRSDGEEDANNNGRVDEGESNPNRPDEAPAQQQDGQGQQDPPTEGEQSASDVGQPDPISLTPEQAERLLAALEDRRPQGERKVAEADKKTRSAKDW